MTTLAGRFRLIKLIVPKPDNIATAFERFTTAIQKRDSCHRVIALQRTVDEHPHAFKAYNRAMESLGTFRDENKGKG